MLLIFLGDYSFLSTPLSSVSIPEGVTSIGNYNILNKKIVYFLSLNSNETVFLIVLSNFCC